MRDGIREEIEAAAGNFEDTLPELQERIDALSIPVDPMTEHFMEEFSAAQVTAAKLAELKAKYGALTIAGANDKKGYDLVHAGRMEVRSYRTAVDKTRKALNEEHQEYIRKVNAEAKRITGLLLEIEEPLDAEETRIDKEIAALKAAKQKEADDRLQARVTALTAVGATFQISELVMMSDMVFDMVLKTATEAWEAREVVRKETEARAQAYEAEKAREAAAVEEEKRRKAQEEAAALAEERKKLALQKAENDRITAELKAQQEAIDRQKSEVERKAQEEKIRQEAEANAKVKAEQEAKAKAERAAAIEAAKPDADKLHTLAMEIETMNYPEMSTEAGKALLIDIKAAGLRLGAYIHTKAKGLTE